MIKFQESHNNLIVLYEVSVIVKWFWQYIDS